MIMKKIINDKYTLNDDFYQTDLYVLSEFCGSYLTLKVTKHKSDNSERVFIVLKPIRNSQTEEVSVDLKTIKTYLDCLSYDSNKIEYDEF